MIADLSSLALAAIAMAAFCTFAIAQAFGLLRRGARANAFYALLLPPYGSWLAFRAGMKVRAIGCVVSLLVYGIARFSA